MNVSLIKATILIVVFLIELKSELISFIGRKHQVITV
jgi:hypothetical protein